MMICTFRNLFGGSKLLNPGIPNSQRTNAPWNDMMVECTLNVMAVLGSKDHILKGHRGLIRHPAGFGIDTAAHTSPRLKSQVKKTRISGPPTI